MLISQTVSCCEPALTFSLFKQDSRLSVTLTKCCESLSEQREETLREKQAKRAFGEDFCGHIWFCDLPNIIITTVSHCYYCYLTVRLEDVISSLLCFCCCKLLLSVAMSSCLLPSIHTYIMCSSWCSYYFVVDYYVFQIFVFQTVN